MVITLRQYLIYVGHVGIVSIGNCLRIFIALFDEGAHLTDADLTAANMWLAQKVVCDPPGFIFGHA